MLEAFVDLLCIVQRSEQLLVPQQGRIEQRRLLSLLVDQSLYSPLKKAPHLHVGNTELCTPHVAAINWQTQISHVSVTVQLRWL